MSDAEIQDVKVKVFAFDMLYLKEPQGKDSTSSSSSSCANSGGSGGGGGREGSGSLLMMPFQERRRLLYASFIQRSNQDVEG